MNIAGESLSPIEENKPEKKPQKKISHKFSKVIGIKSL